MTEASRDNQPGRPVPDNSMVLPTNVISRPLDYLVESIGKLGAWLWMATLAVIIANVVDRFVFGRGSIALEELSWHFFGAAMLLSLSYAVVTDDHVRVDFLRERFSLRKRAWIDMVLILLLALPVLFILTEETYSYASRSFQSMERSQAPSGLPYRFIIKSMMPIGFALVMVALSSRVLRCASLLFGFPRPIWEGTTRKAADSGTSSSTDSTSE